MDSRSQTYSDTGAAAQLSYEEAFGREEAARQRLNDSISLIQHVATLLMNPENLYVANVGFVLPPGLHYEVDGRTWPTGTELAEVLSDWDSARQTARRAWAALPDAEKRRLRRPPP